ncbi:MAG TPA: BON domain-containing protein [Usitatibacter sp.]|jgi:osmotically-inducible protein OsmY|nr:BON domain-containing protein [Usitatibacter sp.]
MKSTLTAVALAASALATLPGCIPLALTGAGTAALMASDRRTTGMYIEDENIELKILGSRDRFGNAHVNATSYNRRVLLTGEAPDEATRSKVEAEVRSIASVRDVTNELQVAGNSSLASRGSDALITSNVKARMVNNPKFSATHVKVVTEAGTVYLLGLVTPEEGDAAVDIARTTSGVVRVVKVFEYIGK